MADMLTAHIALHDIPFLFGGGLRTKKLTELPVVDYSNKRGCVATC